jgi:hypothetical protein
MLDMSTLKEIRLKNHRQLVWMMGNSLIKLEPGRLGEEGKRCIDGKRATETNEKNVLRR